MNLHKAAQGKKKKVAVSLSQFADNAEAMRLIELVKARKAPFIFLTGSAGSGKTTLIKLIIDNTKNAVLTATTGIAAMNIGGQTLHSLFRLGAKLMLKSELVKHKCPNQALFDKLEVLVIDEISMLRADMLDAVDQLLRKWRKRPEPFGGVMIIGSGDLLQLPPVVGRNEAEVFFRAYPSPWFFYANVMAGVDAELLELKKLYRQQDPIFLDALNRIRENNDHRDAVALINRNCYRDIPADFKPDLTLCARNDRADHINLSRLRELKTKSVLYRGEITGNINPRSRLPAPLELELKEGCRVMITKNIDGAVNGQLGTVKKLGRDEVEVVLDSGATIHVEQAEWEQTRYRINAQDEIEAMEGADSYKQLPLTLGYAVSICESQSSFVLGSAIMALFYTANRY